MILCDVRGKFLYEARPDLFPEGFLSESEIELWDLYYEYKASLHKR